MYASAAMGRSAAPTNTVTNRDDTLHKAARISTSHRDSQESRPFQLNLFRYSGDARIQDRERLVNSFPRNSGSF
jgi:hypothetical protein